MRKLFCIAFSVLTFGVLASAQVAPKVSLHGFIRNYYAVDSHEMVAGTEDLFTYLPKDGEQYEYTNARFAALTSRLWVDVKGYEYRDIKMGARIEADFYNGLGTDKVTGTASFRLRQAFLTINKNNWSLKAGQAWHPLASDMPDVFSLNAGAPFGPFNRSPLLQFDITFLQNYSFTAAAVYQMQYASNGPSGKTANYSKWSCIPEIYLGLNYSTDALLMRLGIDILTIKPRLYGKDGKFVDDELVAPSPFLYAQWSKNDFTVKFKTIFAQAGDHLNLNGGYGISHIIDDHYEYSATRNLSSWLSLKFSDNNVDYILFGGYAKNFGTSTALDIPSTATKESDYFFFSSNSYSNFLDMFRLTPTIIYNYGKLALGFEAEITSVTYGDKALGMNLKNALYDKGDSHKVLNKRYQIMIKYTF